MTFVKAQKTQKKLRLALIGPASSGKTYSALAIATTLCPGKVALIDSEHGSASAYADLFHFDTMSLLTFPPAIYREAIGAAVKGGYQAVVIDSLSHAWSGSGGALEMVDQAAAKSKSGNSYFAWRDVTPEHNKLIDAIVGCPIHVIATMRSKVDYVVEPDKNGRMVPRKIGMAPVQREGMDYEFDIVGDINLEHQMVIAKTRLPHLDGQVIAKPGTTFAEDLLAWLDISTFNGVSNPVIATTGLPEPTQPPADYPTVSDEESAELSMLLRESNANVAGFLKHFVIPVISKMPVEHFAYAVTSLKDKPISDRTYDRLDKALAARGADIATVSKHLRETYGKGHLRDLTTGQALHLEAKMMESAK